MNLTIEHASAAVTVDSSIAQAAGTMRLTANAAQGVTFKKAVTTTSTTLGAGTAATFEAAANLGNLTLGAGATVAGTGSLTLGSLTLDLSSYTTDYTNVHTLVSTTGELSFTGDLSSYQDVVVGDYVATISNTGNSLLLTFTAQPEPGETVFTVLDQVGYANGALTLAVDADLLDYDFSEDGAIIIPGIDGDIMKEILSLTNLPEDGMVGITLLGTDGETLSATGEGQIGFLGKDGNSVYYGGAVGSGWLYQVSYIPEPTTATLSLLALCGLAARRRRKA
jgi:MYXO-CTERM domain-containing protein